MNAYTEIYRKGKEKKEKGKKEKLVAVTDIQRYYLCMNR